MEQIEFVKRVKASIVDSNLNSYVELFTSTDIQAAKDSYWKNALLLFNKLTASEKEIFFSIINQVGIDVISKFLGILDGSSFFKEETTFRLYVDDDTDVINGQLQDTFLELVEDQTK